MKKKNVILSGVVSFVLGFGFSGFVAWKTAQTFLWYSERGYQTVTTPMSVLEIVVLAVKAGLILFGIISAIIYIKKWSEPVEVSEKKTKITS